MRWTRRELLKFAAETGFEAPSLEKVAHLEEVLTAVAEHPRLAASLVLKGGTALNLFFGSPSRLSVDLDLNYVGRVERAQMLEERPRIEADLERVARDCGYALQRSRDTHAGRTFFLSFRRAVDGLPDRVELDVNFLHRQCLLKPERRRMWSPQSASLGPDFTVLSFDELAAGKLIALLDRAAPRDAWDATLLTKIAGGSWPGQLSKAIFVAMAGALPHPLHTYSASGLSRITDRDVERLLHPMLVKEEAPTGEELRTAAAVVLEPFLDLTSEEREYCDRLQEGDLVPELLFSSQPEIAVRLAESPPLKWKALNARRHG